MRIIYNPEFGYGFIILLCCVLLGIGVRSYRKVGSTEAMWLGAAGLWLASPLYLFSDQMNALRSGNPVVHHAHHIPVLLSLAPAMITTIALSAWSAWVNRQKDLDHQ